MKYIKHYENFNLHKNNIYVIRHIIDDFNIHYDIMSNDINIGKIKLEKENSRYIIKDSEIIEKLRGKGLYKLAIFCIVRDLNGQKIWSVNKNRYAKKAWENIFNNLPNDIEGGIEDGEFQYYGFKIHWLKTII